MIEAEFGLKGFAIIVKLYQKIYGGFGYYCEWTNDVGLLFSQDVCEGYSSVSEIVSAAIRRGIFDKDLYEKYQILTSRGVQKRYFSAVSRRKQINVKSEYLLVEVAQFSENVNILSENVCRNAKNVCNLQQSKEKKRKEENRKEKKKKNARPQGGYDRILADIEDETLGFSFTGKGELRNAYIKSSGQQGQKAEIPGQSELYRRPWQLSPG